MIAVQGRPHGQRVLQRRYIVRAQDVGPLRGGEEFGGQSGWACLRDVDLREWTRRGEAILDLRKPPFQGRDALYEAARVVLLPGWQQGTPF